VYLGIVNKTPMAELAKQMGTGGRPLSRQRIAKYRGALRDRGVIRRRDDVPKYSKVTEEYAWVPTDTPVVERVELPAGARLRLALPQEVQRNQEVPPIRLVLWESWSVQGIPMRRPDGRGPKDALPTHRVVVIAHLERGTERAVLVPLREPWAESQTQGLRLAGAGQHVRELTMMIACAVGVEAVLTVEIKPWVAGESVDESTMDDQEGDQ
jgi:hypothetical protein